MLTPNDLMYLPHAEAARATQEAINIILARRDTIIGNARSWGEEDLISWPKTCGLSEAGTLTLQVLVEQIAASTQDPDPRLVSGDASAPVIRVPQGAIFEVIEMLPDLGSPWARGYVWDLPRKSPFVRFYVVVGGLTIYCKHISDATWQIQSIWGRGGVAGGTYDAAFPSPCILGCAILYAITSQYAQIRPMIQKRGHRREKRREYTVVSREVPANPSRTPPAASQPQVTVTYDHEADVSPDPVSGPGKCPHLRAGHWHGYWTGSGEERALVKRWLPEIRVHGDRM